jgi:hypothetical protein
MLLQHSQKKLGATLNPVQPSWSMSANINKSTFYEKTYPLSFDLFPGYSFYSL